MACIITYKNNKYSQQEFEKYFKNNFNEFFNEFLSQDIEGFKKFVEQPINKEIKPNEVKGENITSKGSEFAKKLTNVGNSVGLTYKGKEYVNSEHAYQTWKSGEFNQAGYNLKGGKVRGGKIGDTFSIMTDILTEKLKQHPDLVQGITERGGLEYLQKSTHNVIGDKFWESTGQNKFIEALTQAYKNSTQPTEIKPKIDSSNLNLRIKKAIDDIKILLEIGENPNELIDENIKLDKNKIIFAPEEGEKTIEPEHISLPEKYRGKGLGVALYILKGEQAKERGKILINSDGFKPEAAKVWLKLVELGLATQAGDYATFQYTGLTGKELDYFKNNYKNKPTSIKRNLVDLENRITDFEPKVQKLFNEPTLELYSEVIGNYEFDLSAEISDTIRKDIESKLRDVKNSFTITQELTQEQPIIEETKENFNNLSEYTNEEKKKILTTFASKYNISEQQALDDINKALKENKQGTIDNLNECF